MPAPLARRDPRTRSASLVRTIRVAKMLRGATLSELATSLSCTERTIRRDIAALEEVHAPIVRKGDRFVLMGPLA